MKVKAKPGGDVPPGPTSLRLGGVRTSLARPEMGALLMLVGFGAIFSLLSDHFLTVRNLSVVVQPIPELALIALGVTILMIAGEFDLSVGSVFVLVPMITVILILQGVSVALAIVVGLVAGVAVGFVNALITLRLNIPSFIATLGTLFMVRSLAVVLAGNYAPNFPRDIATTWLTGRLGDTTFRASLIYLFVIAVLLSLLLRHTNLGRWIFATGGNTQAARDMGINVFSVKAFCFMLCSLLAGVAGLIQVFRIQAIVPSMGQGFELQAIAATVIGGASLTGGIGSVVGAVVGSLLLAIIENFLILSRVDANWFRFAVGGLIVFAVVVNNFMRSRAARIRG